MPLCNLTFVAMDYSSCENQDLYVRAVIFRACACGDMLEYQPVVLCQPHYRFKPKICSTYYTVT
jgi:hypothetical protein